jgi:hypothetical protein
MVENNFDKALLSAIEVGLCPLGDSSKEAIFYHLEKSFDIRKDNIPTRLKEFREALEEIFGPGAQTIGKLITKYLQGELGLNSKPVKSVDIVEYVEIAKRQVVRR